MRRYVYVLRYFELGCIRVDRCELVGFEIIRGATGNPDCLNVYVCETGNQIPMPPVKVPLSEVVEGATVYEMCVLPIIEFVRRRDERAKG